MSTSIFLKYLVSPTNESITSQTGDSTMTSSSTDTTRSSSATSKPTAFPTEMPTKSYAGEGEISEIEETMAQDQDKANAESDNDSSLIYIYIAITMMSCCCIVICLFAIYKWLKKDEESVHMEGIIEVGNKKEIDNMSSCDSKLSPSSASSPQLNNVPSSTDIETDKQIQIETYDNMENIDIQNWLNCKVELPQYLNTLIMNGYKDLNGIQQIENVKELENIGIVNKEHQQKIMYQINIMKTVITPWSPNDNDNYDTMQLREVKMEHNVSNDGNNGTEMHQIKSFGSIEVDTLPSVLSYPDDNQSEELYVKHQVITTKNASTTQMDEGQQTTGQHPEGDV